jgi:hypothetical protein
LGFTGTVFGDDGKPLKAIIHVSEIDKNVYSNPENGYYHRMVLPGTYTVWAEHLGDAQSTARYRSSQAQEIVVSEKTILHDIDFVLEQYDNLNDSDSSDSAACTSLS